MNEQIEKLIDDAKLTAVSEMFEDELVEFAELIVRECTNKMCKVIENTEQNDLAYNAMLTAIIADIRESFGIQERRAERFSRSIVLAFKNGVDLSGQETP